MALVVLLLSGGAPAQQNTGGSSPAASQTKPALPKMVSASVPFYPELARQAGIEGTVWLRVETDGKRVSSVDAGSGPPLLVRAVKENVKTWEFEPHAAMSVEVTFLYRLLVPECDSHCRCGTAEKESVLLQLPTRVELTARTLLTCDPAVEIRKKK